MKMESPQERQLTELDFVRLRKLAAGQADEVLDRLLADADVVPGREIEADVVTMYTRFELEDEQGERHALAICWPQDAEPTTGFISVLSPLGRSAIGLRAGAPLRWHTPAGAAQGRIAAVLFQPEASGDYVT